MPGVLNSSPLSFLCWDLIRSLAKAHHSVLTQAQIWLKWKNWWLVPTLSCFFLEGGVFYCFKMLRNNTTWDRQSMWDTLSTFRPILWMPERPVMQLTSNWNWNSQLLTPNVVLMNITPWSWHLGSTKQDVLKTRKLNRTWNIIGPIRKGYGVSWDFLILLKKWQPTLLDFWIVWLDGDIIFKGAVF